VLNGYARIPVVEGSTLQAVTDAHGVDAYGVGANSAQPHGLGEPFTTVIPVYNRPLRLPRHVLLWRRHKNTNHIFYQVHSVYDVNTCTLLISGQPHCETTDYRLSDTTASKSLGTTCVILMVPLYPSNLPRGFQIFGFGNHFRAGGFSGLG